MTKAKTEPTEPKVDPTVPTYEEVVGALRGQLAEAHMQITMLNLRLFKQGELLRSLQEEQDAD